VILKIIDATNVVRVFENQLSLIVLKVRLLFSNSNTALLFVSI
jgi:hypothetical protein